MMINNLVGGWALPLWKMMEWKSVKDDIPNIFLENKSHVWNHQPGLMVYNAGGTPGTRVDFGNLHTRAPHVDAGPLPAHTAVQLRALRSVGAQGADHLRWFLNINKTFKTIENIIYVTTKY